ncbi:hypothetical protein BVRB_4g082100 [Beta vulgaris subsp. vulgaris]|nr:hypothetical protein BVRB_4g082100 [Beta vulgaris subsp. vulgaris]
MLFFSVSGLLWANIEWDVSGLFIRQNPDFHLVCSLAYSFDVWLICSSAL